MSKWQCEDGRGCDYQGDGANLVRRWSESGKASGWIRQDEEGEMERSLGRIGQFSARGRLLGVGVKVEDAVAETREIPRWGEVGRENGGRRQLSAIEFARGISESGRAGRGNLVRKEVRVGTERGI